MIHHRSECRLPTQRHRFVDATESITPDKHRSQKQCIADAKSRYEEQLGAKENSNRDKTRYVLQPSPHKQEGRDDRASEVAVLGFAFGKDGLLAEIADQVEGRAERDDVLVKKQA